MIIESRSPETTYRLGEAIGRQVKPGDIICLSGDLGVGKTVFTVYQARGIWTNSAMKNIFTGMAYAL